MSNKRMKLDQVINLLVDDDDNEISSENESNDENDMQSVNKSDESTDDDLPLSMLVARRIITPIKPFQSNQLRKRVSDDDESMESSDDEDDLPLSALAAKKTIRKPFQQQDINIQKSINTNLKLNDEKQEIKQKRSVYQKVNSFLKGIFDSIELDSEDESEESKEKNKSNKINIYKTSDSPVLNYDRNVTRFILSLKNLKRKSYN